MRKLLSVIIPVFNEEKTIRKIIEKIKGINLENIDIQIIVVNDGSTDETKNILNKLAINATVIHHNQNLGKGAAIKTALPHAKGDFIIIQDADLEYDPKDWPALIKALEKNEWLSAVYGSRNLKKTSKGYLHYYLGGRLLTALINFLFRANFTDINTGYKLFRKNILQSLNIQSNGFEFCEEVTVKMIKNKMKVKEIPIEYNPRTFKEGKKISFKDGLIGIWTIIKNFLY